MRVLPRSGEAVKTGPTGTGGARAAQTAEETPFTPAGTIAATNVQDAIEEAVAEASGGPDLSGIDFLVGTASGLLSAEIAVGTTPGGELGNTWASPTVDTTHSGSSHAGVVTTHEAAGDPHPGYILESLAAAKGDIFAASANDTPAILSAGTDGYRLQSRAGASLGIEWIAEYVTVPFFASSGSVLSTGLLFWQPLYLIGTIVACTLDSFESGSIVIDIGLAQESTWVGTHFASICASAKPTITTSRRGGSALTGWSTGIVMDDMLTFNVDSVTSIKRVAGALKVRRTG